MALRGTQVPRRPNRSVEELHSVSMAFHRVSERVSKDIRGLPVNSGTSKRRVKRFLSGFRGALQCVSMKFPNVHKKFLGMSGGFTCD